MIDVDLFEEWLRRTTNLGERSIRLYTRTIRRFLSLYPEVTIENINDFIFKSSKERRSVYVRYAFKYLLTFLDRKDEYKDVVSVRQPVKKRVGCYLPKEEIIKIIENIKDERYKMVALIQFLTGARAHDVLSFNKNDVIEKDETLFLRLIPKGRRKEHIVVIPKKFKERVLNFIEVSTSEYPFLRGDISNITRAVDNNYKYYFDALKKSAKLCGYPEFSTHDFRRNFAEDLRENETDIIEISNMLGHSSPIYTLHYLQQNKADMKKRIQSAEKIRG